MGGIWRFEKRTILSENKPTLTQSLKNAFFSLRPGHSVSVVLNNDVAVIEIQEEGTINFEKVDTPLLIKF